jgi:hypothetical protein
LPIHYRYITDTIYDLGLTPLWLSVFTPHVLKIFLLNSAFRLKKRRHKMNRRHKGLAFKNGIILVIVYKYCIGIPPNEAHGAWPPVV